VDPQSLSRGLSERLISFAWSQWAQMGLLASTPERSRWAQDPEALIIFTLEVARGEPRLFDELLDWIALNEGLLSVRRLRAMCIDDSDRALLEGTLAWLARQHPRARLTSRDSGPAALALEPLFRSSGPGGEQDPSFASAGLARSRLDRSHNARRPDVSAPINFAFRLREILGVGIRAETMRVLLGTSAPWVTAQALARATGYSKRNVHEAVAALADARVILALTVGNEQRYTVERTAWSALLQSDPKRLPIHRDWPQLLGALRRILRFTERTQRESLSEYLLASATRDLLEALQPDLAFAGIPVTIGSTSENAWHELTDTIERTLATMIVAPTRLPPGLPEPLQLAGDPHALSRALDEIRGER
jgi:hypothetical protein